MIKDHASKGGTAVVKKYGHTHMAEIGSKGGKATRRKYRLMPYNLNDFLIVNRITGAVNPKTLNGNPAPKVDWEGILGEGYK